jgi:hypothetical protein
MKQKKLIKSLLHLVSYGFIAKCLSVIAKIITTRAVGVEGMNQNIFVVRTKYFDGQVFVTKVANR